MSGWNDDGPVNENNGVRERDCGSIEQAEEECAAASWMGEELLELDSKAVNSGVGVAVRDEVHQSPRLH